MSLPEDLDRLSHAELKGLVVKQWEQMVELRRMVMALRDEVARLKGGPGRPNIKPSGMERGTEPKRPGSSGSHKRPRGSTRSKLSIDEEQAVKVAAPPRGSRFKGYTSFVVQDLVIRPHVVNFRCERWQTPDGAMMTAPLPAGIDGHFGPQLRRFVLAQYHQGQMTVPRLVTLLRSLGILISKPPGGASADLPRAGRPRLTRSTCRAGLSSAAWITVDDTHASSMAARQMGNAPREVRHRLQVAWRYCCAPATARFVIMSEALTYMRARALAASAVIARLVPSIPTAASPVRRSVDAHLEKRISGQGHRPRIRVSWRHRGGVGGSKETAVLPVRYGHVVSDDEPGQFNVGRHGLCWVHSERLVHKLDAFTDQSRAAQASVRNLIWQFYGDLKNYRSDPGKQRKAALRARFDRIFQRKTGFVTLDRLLARLHANKPELLMVLDRPEIPLHTNGSENDVRCQVTRRKVSGGTRSDAGRDCRDAFLGIAKTCAKLEIAFWDYLGARLNVPGAPVIPYLPNLVLARSRSP